MIIRTIEYVKANNLLLADQKLLLAVSGGIDSMVMLEIFGHLPYEFFVAHCNFSLRGEEADDDQRFVENYCRNRNITLYVKKFDTHAYAKKNRISIQMAARDLRYAWFEELCKLHSIDRVLLAHNKNDNIETFLINFSRGTGLKGLTGIKNKSNCYIRPLLFATRDEIDRYASENKIPYREDSSNSQNKYKRNRIRHDIIPVFKDINPSFEESADKTISRLYEASFIVSEQIRNTREKIFKTRKGKIIVPVSQLLSLNPLDLYLFELFSPYNIGQDQVDEIKKLLNSEAGHKIYTSAYVLLKDRDTIIIYKDNFRTQQTIVAATPEEIGSTGLYSVNIHLSEEYKISSDNKVAALDYDRISFPVTIRAWKRGDWFFPLGMDKKKKLSDLFTDNKIPSPEKKNIPVFVSGEDIIWVAGLRIDNRYRITENTSRVLEIRLKD